MIALAIVDVLAIGLAGFATWLWYREREARAEYERARDTTLEQMREIATSAIEAARVAKIEREATDSILVFERAQWTKDLGALRAQLDALIAFKGCMHECLGSKTT